MSKEITSKNLRIKGKPEGLDVLHFMSGSAGAADFAKILAVESVRFSSPESESLRV